MLEKKEVKRRIFNPKKDALSKAIIVSVSDKFETSPESILRRSKTRKKEDALIRSWVWYFARQFRFTSTSIGEYFKKNHATILAATKKVESYLDVYEDEKAVHSEILQNIAKTYPTLSTKGSATKELAKQNSLFTLN